MSAQRPQVCADLSASWLRLHCLGRKGGKSTSISTGTLGVTGTHATTPAGGPRSAQSQHLLLTGNKQGSNHTEPLCSPFWKVAGQRARIL